METYLQDANDIWADFRKRLGDSQFEELGPDDQLTFYQKKFNKFTLSFPIVLRYMIQMRAYNKKAFKKFIKKLQLKPYRSELEYCERQADYVKYLYMELSPTHNMKAAQREWQTVYDMLVKEIEIFKNAEKTVKKKLEKNNSLNKEERRKELKRAIVSISGDSL